MRAKTVNEANFERYKDPKKALGFVYAPKTPIGTVTDEEINTFIREIVLLKYDNLKLSEDRRTGNVEIIFGSKILKYKRSKSGMTVQVFLWDDNYFGPIPTDAQFGTKCSTLGAVQKAYETYIKEATE